MQLLIFARTPPPADDSGRLVRTLLDGLPATSPAIKVFHVNPRLRRSEGEIGDGGPVSWLSLTGAIFHALALRVRRGPMTFYYVPAAGNRSALYRDWWVMFACRPFFNALVLHWHHAGLGAWLALHATALERALTRLFLGRAALSIVVAPTRASDAQSLTPRRLAVVPNGVDAPVANPLDANDEINARKTAEATFPHCHVLFIGTGSRASGLFDTLTAIGIANRKRIGGFRLTVAGPFASVLDQHAFFSQTLALGPNVVRHAGVVDVLQKGRLLAAADILCFPSNDTKACQPLVLIDALAHDLPVITTRHQATSGILPEGQACFVDAGRPDQIAAAMIGVADSPPPAGALRDCYLSQFTQHQHLAALKEALVPIPPAT